MKKKLTIILLVLAALAIVIGVIVMLKNLVLAKNKIEIIDATYSCNGVQEVFYEDDNFIYTFPCTQSTSTYVKFSNGNKMLVTEALDEELVTINDLIKAGLSVIKTEK